MQFPYPIDSSLEFQLQRQDLDLLAMVTFFHASFEEIYKEKIRERKNNPKQKIKENENKSPRSELLT